MEDIQWYGALWSGVFTLLGIGFWVYTIKKWRRLRIFSERAIQVEGTVVAKTMINNKQYSVIQFYDQTGSMHQGKYRLHQSTEIGTPIPIYYDPKNPQEFSFTLQGLGCAVIIPMISGTVFIFKGVVLLLILLLS